MITKITCRYSFEVLDFNCNDFGFTFNIGVPYLGIFIRHQWLGHVEWNFGWTAINRMVPPGRLMNLKDNVKMTGVTGNVRITIDLQ